MSVTRHKHRRARRVILLLVLVVFVIGIALAVLFIAPYAVSEMDMSLLDLPATSEPAKLLAYDPPNRAAREGQTHPAPDPMLSPPERRIFVSYDDMPADLIHAFVAIEDKRFYHHHGVDILRTARAGFGYLTGNASFGGSTITQQLVKNLTGHDENTVDRKLTEIFLALDLERHAEKTNVLECYLNIINLAEGCRGVGAAAERYFSKSVGDLTLAECATIAAITQNPARYNPLNHPAAARARRDLILREMEKQGYITAADRDTAMASELTLTPGDFGTGRTTAGPVISSWYTDMVAADVIRDLVERLGYTRASASRLLYSGGLTVETAMDEELQAIVETYYADPSHFPVGEDGRPQSSFILIDPATGDILAVAGAVGEKQGNRLQNYATDTLRPAGSCIKPLSVYAPAIEEGGLTWASLYEDEPIDVQNGALWPRNADGLYRGRVTVGVSVAESINTVAVRILSEVGEDTAFAYLRNRFGLSELTDADRTVSSLALGQQSHGVTSRALTAAYTACMDGIYRPPVSYHRVLDKEGKVLLENPKTEQVVLSPTTAALLTRLLEAVADHGTASRYLTLPETLGISCAGKTGTTQNNCDRRYVGYTPRLLAGVWMGYDYPTELRGITGNPCVGIWDELMAACESTYRGAPRQDAFVTNFLVESDFCPLSGGLPNPYCTTPAEHGWFIPGTEPRELCSMHEEPPISIIPEDPREPDRIPILPNDLLPEESDSIIPSAPIPWYNRFKSPWFTRHARPKV